MMRDMGQLDLSLRVAKRAMQKRLEMVSYAYPVVKVPSYRGRGKAPEPAYVLGLSRQESEFDPSAISSAGARGLMQLMPETARRTAKAHGFSFDQNKLTRDSEYNMALGMAYLSDLMDDFGGSYILTTAAYNAGPSRVRQWLGTYGDPRSSSVDPIDWMEQIPFSETRNYVQRVIENTQVYRQRLAHAPVPLLLSADIRRRSVSASETTRAAVEPAAEPTTPETSTAPSRLPEELTEAATPASAQTMSE
jgi:soluble lytic murein transglycosylase